MLNNLNVFYKCVNFGWLNLLSCGKNQVTKSAKKVIETDPYPQTCKFRVRFWHLVASTHWIIYAYQFSSRNSNFEQRFCENINHIGVLDTFYSCIWGRFKFSLRILTKLIPYGKRISHRTPEHQNLQKHISLRIGISFSHFFSTFCDLIFSTTKKIQPTKIYTFVEHIKVIEHAKFYIKMLNHCVYKCVLILRVTSPQFNH